MAGAGQKFIHLVDAELSYDAQFKSYSEIPSHALNFGSTIRFLPGTYEMGTVNVDSLTFEGVGNSADVILANLKLGSATANTNVFKNLTLRGSNTEAASGSNSIAILDGATGTVTFRDVIFTNADFMIDNQGRANFLEIENCEGITDRGIRSNSTASANIWFSVLNTLSANVYFTTLNNDEARPFRVIASRSAGSNSGNSVKTVSALLS